MAPATATASLITAAFVTPTLTPQHKDWNGDEFSNNLFSDLAPLLTLFGEQVTKQFLTMSIGWADNLLIAMGPLGILTVVVSAIRVGGVKRLKALVGSKAQESQATAERELLSSTSDSVCELWSGQEVVRQFGRPDMKEIVIVREYLTNAIRLGPNAEGIHQTVKGVNQADRDSLLAVLELKEALAGKWLVESNPSRVSSQRLNPRGEERGLEKFFEQAPNISLNVEGAAATRKELWLWAIFGIGLQALGLLFPAVATYHWNWSKGSLPVPRYAYPCFLIGSSAVILGMVFCSRVIEGVTVERMFSPPKEADISAGVLRILRIQRACTVSDQTFPPCLIFNPINNRNIRTSRLELTHVSRLSTLAGFASLLTVSGFVCQFIGLRSLHWSATILQLGVTLIMTVARSWVRRGLAIVPEHVELTPGHELTEAAIYLSLDDLYPDIGGNHPLPSMSSFRKTRDWEIFTGWYTTDGSLQVEDRARSTNHQTPTSFSATETQRALFQRRIRFRQKLQVLMPSKDTSSRLASSLTRAIVQTCLLFKLADSDGLVTIDGDRIRWGLRIRCTPLSASYITHYLYCSNNSGTFSAPEELPALLSLWAYSLRKPHAQSATVEQEINDGEQREEYMRVLGFTKCYGNTLPALPGWIGKEVFFCPYPDGFGTFARPKTYPRFAAPSWPVFGMSNVTENREPAQSSTTNQRILKYADLQGKLFVSSVASAGKINEEIKVKCVSIVSAESKAKQCALELFSGFMGGIVDNVKALGGEMSYVPAPQRIRRLHVHEVPERNSGLDSSYDGERWTNSVLLSVSRVLVDTGLASSIEEANAVVIPPFARRGLLPTEPGSVIVPRYDASYSTDGKQKQEVTPNTEGGV